MSETFAELAKQAPSLGILVLVVWFFLQHLEKRDVREERSQKMLADALGSLEKAITALRDEVMRHKD